LPEKQKGLKSAALSLAVQMPERKRRTDHDKNENRISKKEMMMEFLSLQKGHVDLGT
jgi:hypothetical protein